MGANPLKTLRFSTWTICNLTPRAGRGMVCPSPEPTAVHYCKIYNLVAAIKLTSQRYPCGERSEAFFLPRWKGVQHCRRPKRIAQREPPCRFSCYSEPMQWCMGSGQQEGFCACLSCPTSLPPSGGQCKKGPALLLRVIWRRRDGRLTTSIPP
jgi:hypothetical protein